MRRYLPIAKTAATVAGVVGVGALLYDAHHWGKIKANEYHQNRDASANLRFFNNTQYGPNQSHIMNNIKKKMFRWSLGNRIRGDVNSVIGYTKGIASNLIDGAVPLAASLTAILAKGAKTKLIGGAVLAGWAGLSFLRNGCSHLFGKRP